MELTDRQKYVLYRITKGVKDGIKEQTMGGYAGTGKTTLIRYLIGFCPDFGVAAYTGKAANVLRRKNIRAQTIHSTIYRPVYDYGVLVGFDLVPRSELGFNGFFIDEASMVSEEIYKDLKSYNLPLVFVGDHGQLEPIGTDFNLMKKPDYTLEEIHRNAGDIAMFAERLRKGFKSTSFQECEKVQFISKRRLTTENLLSVDQVICAYNKTRVAFNAQIREGLGHSGLLNVGERVMCLKNNKNLGLFNGMQGIVRNLYECDHTGRKLMDFEFNDCLYAGIWYDTKQFGQEKPSGDCYVGRDYPNPFDYAYAITCHKCVHPDTLVETDEGLLPIRSINQNGYIATPHGRKPYMNFVSNPPAPSVRFNTQDGYQITVTEDHKVEVWDGENYVLKEAREVKNGFFRLRLGATVDAKGLCPLPPAPTNIDVRTTIYPVPAEVTQEVAEFLGLMVADGTVWETGFRLAKQHSDVCDRFAELCVKLFQCEPRRIKVGETGGCEVNSVFLVKWLRSIGGLEPHQKDVPECILRSPLVIQNRFLRGLFEDGTVNMKKGFVDHIEYYSRFSTLLSKVKTMLLRAGIISGQTNSRPETLYVYGKYCSLFKEQIGFVSSFKNDRLKFCKDTQRYYKVPINRESTKYLKPYVSISDYQNARNRGYISRRLAEQVKNYPGCEFLQDMLCYHHSLVSSTIYSVEPSMCVEVPDGHRFLQNGFPFGNSQGDEWSKVLVLEQKCSGWDHNRWTYTAASRAKELLVWVY